MVKALQNSYRVIHERVLECECHYMNLASTNVVYNVFLTAVCLLVKGA